MDTKNKIREKIWRILERERVALFPGAHGRIPNFKGAFRFGFPVHPKEIPQIDLIVAGSVAVNRRGSRIGKGGGYSDLY